ncbi:MAG: signal recognition particle-docking protein FtsY [Pseudomonas sp.]|uniref:signal recognition particle-docking protein FtsY n=1 Tax=Pseudomonas sp. TaxID=306 RepID=UPI002735490B|nr:signal recognition particle-docking protein FtsY [Pseudomonas sp.]MDP3847094.1 signal recognition particle-docking protein FtsY [Pseudomonas sp.]
MFGSNDDKKTPAPTAPAAAEKTAEKKDLFGWLRKKPQAPAAEPVVAPAVVPLEPLAVVPADAGLIASAVPAVVEVAPAPAVAPEPVTLPDVVVAEPLVAIPAAIVESVVSAISMPITLAAPAELTPASVADLPPVTVQAPVQFSPAESVTPPVVAAAELAGGEPVAAPRASRFRFNVGSEVLHAHLDVAPLVVPVVVEPLPVAPVVVAEIKPAADNKAGFLDRLKQGLSKTSASIGEGMASLFLGKKAIDDDLLEELETRLLTADVGVEATTAIIQSLTQKVARKQLTDSGALYQALQEELAAMLRPVAKPLVIEPSKKPFVILVVGVNGAGKTTTIGKLAKKLQLEGKKVMLAAGDTFRAAAVEQLQVWGERNQVTVIAQHTGADSASVIFDAVQAATARGMDVLIADTAGRLHTKDNLMEELKKVRRVIGKLDDTAPHEVLLVLDAGTGQNAINQAKQFNQTVNLTGLALTKLDGTAKGGVIFALAKQFGIPIRYIGVGEGIDDLRTFEAESFVQALFAGAEQERP